MTDSSARDNASPSKKNVQADAQKDYEKPIFDLPGPLRPPAAPARYKALTRIRLRVAPHKFADLVTPTYEIQQGQEFRSGGAWFLERGIIGKFAGKKLARRIAGSLEPTKKGPAVMQISEVEEAPAEVLPPATKSEENFEGVNQAPPSPYERRKPVLELLEDPEIQAICKEMGIDMETMKKNPEFVEGIARRLYGDEVVAEHIESEGTSAIKDDWAWWAWKNEDSSAGKLLTVFPDDDVKQVFFDDNVHHSDPRTEVEIIDCRYPDGNQVAPIDSIDKLCCKVNSVEAIIDDEYFLRKLQICHGGNLLINSSLIDFQHQITEAEEQKAALQKDIKALQLQLKSITEENHRMKILHRVDVENEVQLRDFLTQHNCPLDSFGIDGFRKVSDLYGELEQGRCCLELERFFACSGGILGLGFSGPNRNDHTFICLGMSGLYGHVSGIAGCKDTAR
eukprot:s96_g7.t1